MPSLTPAKIKRVAEGMYIYGHPLCLHTGTDQTGELQKGSNRYLINLARDLIPLVNTFWSITLHDSRQHHVANSMLHNAIGDRNRLRVNPDNSLSIHIQHDWPGTAKDSNWLPAPKEAFSLALRMYWPKPDAVTGNWRPPRDPDEVRV